MIRPFGERALLVELGGWREAQALAASLTHEPLPGVEAVVPGRASLLVELEASFPDPVDALITAVAARLARPAPPPAPRRVRTVPVSYGGEHGPDLDAVAAELDLPAEDVVAMHAATEVTVEFCGFAPGFAYLGELPEALRVARLATPRTRTPAGSVAIAGSMTGIYPAELPGGWRVIGRTPLRLFDPRRDPPAYLRPGDVIVWEPIEPADWPATPVAADDW